MTSNFATKNVFAALVAESEDEGEKDETEPEDISEDEDEKDETEAEDMYCFRCNDHQTGLLSDVFVDVDILWEDFTAMLASRFQRPVFILYRRDGDEHSRAVQSEADFEDLCEYLDDKKLQTLPVEVRTFRKKRQIRRQTGDGWAPSGGGVAASHKEAAKADGGGVEPSHKEVAKAAFGANAQIHVGATARIHGLVGNPEHNGATCTVVKHIADTGRWGVKIAPGTVLSLKPENLILVDTRNSHMVNRAEQKERDDRETEEQDDERCGLCNEALALGDRFAVRLSCFFMRRQCSKKACYTCIDKYLRGRRGLRSDDEGAPCPWCTRQIRFVEVQQPEGKWRRCGPDPSVDARFRRMGTLMGHVYIPLCAPPDEQDLSVVIDGLNVATNPSTRQLEWKRLAAMLTHFLTRDIRPYVILPHSVLQRVVDVDLGSGRMLRSYVVTSGREGREMDDLLVASLSHHLKCPFVSNDTFLSWAHESNVCRSSSQRFWVKSGVVLKYHITFEIVLVDDKHTVLLDPEYPVQLAKRLLSAFAAPAPLQPERQDSATCKPKNIRLQDLSSKLFCEVSLEALQSVGMLREFAGRLLKGADESEKKATFLFCSDGVSLDRDESLLEDLCSAAADSPVLVYAIALAWDAVSGGRQSTGSELLKQARQRQLQFFGRTADFMTSGYPKHSPSAHPHSATKQCDAALSAACSVLYVLKDCLQGQRDKIITGLVRCAARHLVSAAPFAVALKMLCAQARLLPSQKAAIIAGLLAAMRVLYPELATDAPHRLLEATPFACAWLLNAGDEWTSPPLVFSKFDLSDFEERENVKEGVRPCIIRGHPEMGILDEADAVSWARVLTLDVPNNALQVTHDCHTIRRLVACADLETWKSIPLWSCCCGGEGGVAGGLSRSGGGGEGEFLLPLPPKLSLSLLRKPFCDPSANETAFQIFPTLEVQKRLTTSLMIWNYSAKGEERVVVFESNCSQKSEGSNPINQDHQNVFFPVEGLSRTEDLRKHAKTVALEYNSAQASSQGVQDASKSSFPTRTKVRVAPEGATEAAGAGTEAETPVLRSRVDEATLVLMDKSASMSESFSPPKRHEMVTAGATSTLFLTFKHDSETFKSKDTVSAILRLLDSHDTAARGGEGGVSRSEINCAQPVDVRPHFHRETQAFKGSCHVKFNTRAHAEAVLESLTARALCPQKGPVTCIKYAPDFRKDFHALDACSQKPETRFAMAQLALHQFAGRCQDQDLPHAMGLLLVGTTVQTACKLTPSQQAFTDTAELAQEERAAERGGNTCLLAGLRSAAQQLYDFRNTHKKCKLRVLVISDGEDTSGDDPLKELATLREAKIVVDVVVLGGARAGDLAAIARYTGGLVLQPLSEADLLSTFEAEALMQLSKRLHVVLPPLPDVHTFRRISKAKGMELASQRRQYRDSEAASSLLGRPGLTARGMLTGLNEAQAGALSSAAAVYKMTGTTASLCMPVAAQTEELRKGTASKAVQYLDGSGSAAEVASPVCYRSMANLNASEQAKSSSRIRRLMMEAKKCINTSQAERELHSQLQVFIGDDLSEWHVILKGPEPCRGCPYCDGTWRLMMRFGEDYPHRAPDVYFVTPILHLNVDSQGKVCHSALDREYMPSAPITHLLSCIVSLLIAPDPDHPFNQALAQVYWESAKKFQGFGEMADWIHETDYFKLVKNEVINKASASADELESEISNTQRDDRNMSPLCQGSFPNKMPVESVPACTAKIPELDRKVKQQSPGKELRVDPHELRVDPHDGNAYPLSSFLEYYGDNAGRRLWATAQRLFAGEVPGKVMAAEVDALVTAKRRIKKEISWMDENGYIVTEEVWEEVGDEQQVKGSATATYCNNKGSATATSALNPKPKPSENKGTEKTKPASKPAEAATSVRVPDAHLLSPPVPPGSVDHEETARAEAGQSGGTLKSKSFQLWSAHDVSRYVQSLQRDFGDKASMYADTMVREDISGSVLLKLEDKDLKELGFSLGHRKVMLLHISAASKNLFF